MQTSKIQNVKTSKHAADRAYSTKGPVARGPLVEVHRAAGATMKIVDGWEVAVRYPGEPTSMAACDPPLMMGDLGGNAIIDFSHWGTYEVGGADVDATLRSIVGVDVPVRRVVAGDGFNVYRLTARRGILFDVAGQRVLEAARAEAHGSLVDVTGGWASFVLCGPDSLNILNKVTALDLREETLPVHGCCQGPIFGVNTLFGRFEHGFELHVCPDSAEFFWEVLMDAGAEFGLKAVGVEQVKIKH